MKPYGSSIITRIIQMAEEVEKFYDTATGINEYMIGIRRPAMPSLFELQPATPSLKEIFDMFEEDFFGSLTKTNYGRTELKEIFLRSKANIAIKLLQKEVMP